MSDSKQAKIKCEKCGQRYRWKPELAGKRVKCKCGHRMNMPEKPPSKPTAKPKPKAADDADASTYDLDHDAHAADKGIKVKCTACGAEMSSNAVLCMKCGFNKRTGEQADGLGTAGGKKKKGGGLLSKRVVVVVVALIAIAAAAGAAWVMYGDSITGN